MTKSYQLLRLSRADFSAIRPFLKEHGKLFTLTVAKSPDNKPRFACVVSKKVARRANQRNLIKRRCRAAIRVAAPQPPYAFVFTAKKGATESDYPQIADEVNSLFVKAAASLKRTPELQ